jgi:hypothetical protein
MTANRSAHPGCDCTDRDFCQWAGTCEDCHPESWRMIDPSAPRSGGSYQGASYEFARKRLKEMAGYYRRLAAELDQAYTDGFRLYDVADSGVIHAAKGRVKT